MAIEKVTRRSIWDGHVTHSEYYDGDKCIGYSVDRTSIWGGKPTKTDYYDDHWNKVASTPRK